MVGIVDGVIVLGAEVLNWLSGFGYEAQQGLGCQDCHHGWVYKRQVGMIGFRHDQYSCPCRLVRENGRQTACGCEWTQDV